MSRSPLSSEAPVAAGGQQGGEVIVRFTIHQIIQHILMMLSFTMLALTGLAQKFDSWAISQWGIGVLGGIDSVRSLHHFFAWVMVVDGVYHLSDIGYSTLVLKKPFPLQMLPTTKDIRDLFHDIRHFTGLAANDPRFGRFSYQEKFDYWAVFWGLPILAATGFILMYPEVTTRFLPGVIVPTALVAHSDEALLAVIWIFGVHFFFVHLAPSVFPLNKSIFTGKVPTALYQKEHPLEWEQLQVAKPAVPPALEPEGVPPLETVEVEAAGAASDPEPNPDDPGETRNDNPQATG